MSSNDINIFFIFTLYSQYKTKRKMNLKNIFVKPQLKDLYL